MKTQNSSTLADQIAGILNSAPANFDPEDESVDATNAQIVQEDIEDDNEEEILSKFRRENVDLLADLDEKYAGKKTSRKNLKSSDSDDSSSDQIGSSSEDDNGEGDEECVRRKSEEKVDSEQESEDMSSDEAEESEDDNQSEGDEAESIEDENSESDTNFKHISESNVSNQVKKGVCVRNQMTMWENLLEARIQLQKCLITANKMPFASTFKEVKKESGSEFINKVTETKSKLCDTLDKLLLLQNLVLKQYPETKKLGQENGTPSKTENDDEEEIPSDTEDEKSANEEEIVEPEPPKKRKLDDYEQDISNQHKTYKNYRNSVIQKWNDKTRVVLKGGATSHSVLDQIEYSLSNKDKLIKRTQLKRSQYSILGQEEKNEDKQEEYLGEIFDDDDFYHQLLRELIEVKSADVTDPVQLGRQWIQLQNLRSKMKRKIDTRATKGRKIRYAVHSKLVNFMAPIDENLWTEEAKSELYNSLFGKNQPVFNV